MTAGPYSIGSRHWPGLAKFAEECAEGVQAAMKIQAAGGADEHWDGTHDLRTRLEDEIADVRAASAYLIEASGLDEQRIASRAAVKLARFQGWHAKHGGRPL